MEYQRDRFVEAPGEFSVRGEMNIPLISTEICKAYPELTSHELLQKAAEELQLK